MAVKSNSRCKERKHQSAWECFPFRWLNHLFVLAGQLFRELVFHVFPEKMGTFSGLVFVHSLSPSPFPNIQRHTYLFVSKLSKFQSLSVCALCPSGDWCGILPLSYSGKIPDVRKLVSPLWLGHVVGQEVLHQALLNSLGDCSSQPNGNKARGVERPPLYLHPPHRPLRARPKHVL